MSLQEVQRSYRMDPFCEDHGPNETPNGSRYGGSIRSNSEEKRRTSPAYERRLMNRELQRAAFASLGEEYPSSLDSSACSSGSTNRRSRSRRRASDGGQTSETTHSTDFADFASFRQNSSSHTSNPSSRGFKEPQRLQQHQQRHQHQQQQQRQQQQQQHTISTDDSVSIHALSLAELSRDSKTTTSVPTRGYRSLNDLERTKLLQASWNEQFFATITPFEQEPLDREKKTKKKSKKKKQQRNMEQERNDHKRRVHHVTNAIAPPPFLFANENSNDAVTGTQTSSERATRRLTSASSRRYEEMGLYPKVTPVDFETQRTSPSVTCESKYCSSARPERREMLHHHFSTPFPDNHHYRPAPEPASLLNASSGQWSSHKSEKQHRPKTNHNYSGESFSQSQRQWSQEANPGKLHSTSERQQRPRKTHISPDNLYCDQPTMRLEQTIPIQLYLQSQSERQHCSTAIYNSPEHSYTHSKRQFSESPSPRQRKDVLVPSKYTEKDAKMLSHHRVGAYHSDNPIENAKKLAKELKEDEESGNRPITILGGLEQPIRKIEVTDVKLIQFRRRRNCILTGSLIILLVGIAVAAGIIGSIYLSDRGDVKPTDTCGMPSIASECTNTEDRILSIPTCAMERYNYLTKTFVLSALPDFDHELDSCEPANLSLWALATSTDGSELSQILVNRFFLGILYYATSGETTWYNRQGWLSEKSVCTSWFGISCDNTTAVTGIELDSNNLVGTIPKEVGFMTSLETLWLHSNSLMMTIPTEIGRLGRLSTLNLVGNKLGGSLPTEIALIMSIQNIKLSYNSFTGTLPTELSMLRNLESLEVFDNQFEGTISQFLSSCAMLRSLDLSENRFIGTLPTQIGLLSNLQTLNVRGNTFRQATIPTEFGSLTQLTELALGTAGLSGTIPTELGLTSLLMKLFLDGNALIGTIPRELMQLKDLEVIRLAINQLTGTLPSEIALCTSLNEVDFSYNRLSGQVPTELGALSKLDKLWIKENDLQGSVPSEICRLRQKSRLNEFQADFCGGELICNEPLCCNCS